MFVQNAWYVAAEPAELANGPLPRTILGHRMVLFRAANGQVGALEDRCPHRMAPLSLGKVVGNNLQCAYHGAEFGADGQCVKVPGQGAVPNAARVRSFPARERYGYIWVWPGDPALSSDESTIPQGFAITSEPAWQGTYGRFESLKADYRLLNDNLFDISHAEFVHPESFGGIEVHYYRQPRAGSDFADRAMTFEVEPSAIHFRTRADKLGMDGAPFWRTMLAHSRGLASWDGAVDYRMKVSWWAPVCWSFHVIVQAPDEHDGKSAEVINLHAAVPETEHSTHYFYRVLRNYGDESLDQPYAEATRFVFSQDTRILEAQQRVLGTADLFDAAPVSFRGDRLQVEARKIISRMARSGE